MIRTPMPTNQLGDVPLAWAHVLSLHILCYHYPTSKDGLLPLPCLFCCPCNVMRCVTSAAPRWRCYAAYTTAVPDWCDLPQVAWCMYLSLTFYSQGKFGA